MRLQGGMSQQRTRKVQVTKNPQKTQNAARLTNVSKGTEMRQNQILQQKTKSLKVTGPKLSTSQINQIKASPKGVLPAFLSPGIKRATKALPMRKKLTKISKPTTY